MIYSLCLLHTERQLTDNDMVFLSSELERDDATQQLILDGNAFGPDGVQALARALMSNKSLTKLLLSRNTIGDEGAAALGAAISSNSRLKVISLASATSFVCYRYYYYSL